MNSSRPAEAGCVALELKMDSNFRPGHEHITPPWREWRQQPIDVHLRVAPCMIYQVLLARSPPLVLLLMSASHEAKEPVPAAGVCVKRLQHLFLRSPARPAGPQRMRRSTGPGVECRMPSKPPASLQEVSLRIMRSAAPHVATRSTAL